MADPQRERRQAAEDGYLLHRYTFKSTETITGELVVATSSQILVRSRAEPIAMPAGASVNRVPGIVAVPAAS